MARRTLRRVGLVLVGAVLGLLLVLFGVWTYLQMQRVVGARAAIAERLRLPADAFRVDVVEDDAIRITLRDVVLHGEAGDTIVAAPFAQLWLDVATLAGEGPIEFFDVELRRPFARLVQRPQDREWNIQQVFRVTAAGEEIDPDTEGRPLLFRRVRLVDGEVILAVLAQEPAPVGFAARLQLPRRQIGGEWYQVYTMRGLDATLPLVRFGDAQDWRVEVESLNTRVVEPDLRIAQLQGWAEAEGEDGVRFDLATLRTGESVLAGSGLIRFTEPEITYDVELQAAPLAFADVRALIPALTEEGEARFAMTLQTRPDGRTALALRDLQLFALDSRVAGRISLAFGGDEPLVVTDADLSLDPLDLLALEQLGVVEEMPFLGVVVGSVVAVDGTAEIAVDLAASLVPRDDPELTPSRILAAGTLVMDGAATPMGVRNLQIVAEPLYLATLGALLPEQREMLRGEVRGLVTLTGTTQNLQFAGGDVIYLVGDAPPTRLAGFAGSVALDPLRYDVRASAQPLALATLTELFPALPFREAVLAGPIRIEGDADAARLALDLTGPAGGIRVGGTLAFDTPLRFDLEGSLQAFLPGQIVQGEIPIEGPMTGTFAVRGTTEDVRFDVDITQALGRFALGGRVQFTTDPPLFNLAGRVEDFQLGALVGQPALFPAPMTGPIQVAGGAGEPYRFDVDLRGGGSVFDLAGFYQPGPVPSYAVRGEVAGLDLQRLPLDAALPATNIVGRIDVEGRGLTAETFTGRIAFDAPGSTVGGIPVDVATGRLVVSDGVLQVETLTLALGASRLTAEGRWGLTRPVPGAIRYSLVSSDLGELNPIVATMVDWRPQLAGAVQLEGTIAGTLEDPAFTAAGQVQDLPLGALVGQPALFPAPMTGPIQVAGGAGQPYRFDVDLRGGGSVFNLAGYYQPGPVPSYAARGEVAGLDLRRLPIGMPLPATNIVGRIDVEGRGTTAETFTGRIAFDAPGSTVGGLRMDAATGRLVVSDGVLQVETLTLALGASRLTAEGQWGLTRPAPGALRYSFVSTDLGQLAPLIATVQGGPRPQLAGSIRAEGWVSGSLQAPVVATSLAGRRLRFQEWQAATLDLTLQGTFDPATGWGGEATLAGTGLALPGGETLETLRFEASGTEGAVAVGLYARRDPRTDIAASGMLEFDERTPRGVALQTLALRVEETEWRLAGPSRLRWGGIDGLLVENLVVQRVGEPEGFIMVDGRLPPTGTADLRLRAQSVDLRDIQRIVPDAPVIEGILTLDAVFEGPVAAPEMRLEGTVTNLVVEDARADLVTLTADYVAQRLEGSARAVVDGIEIASAEMSIPMVLSYENFIPGFELRTTAPMSVAVVADSLPMALLAAAVPALEDGAGIVQARVDVGGTLDVPEFQGVAAIRNAAVSIVPLGTRYSDIQGRANFAGNRVDIETLTARNVGTMSASGFIQFVPRAGPQVNLTTSFNRFRLMDDRDVATLTGTGQVTLAGQFPSPVLTGRVTLDESTIRVPEFEEETGLEIADLEVGQIGADTLPAFGLAPAFLQQLRIDALEVSLGESVWLVSEDVRVQIAGDLIVYRTGQDLRLFGALEAVRGRYALRIGTIVREFDVVSGRVQFFGTGELNPAVDIVAAHRVRTATAGAGTQLTVLVNVTGTLAAPRIQLTSDTPTPLPESELLSYLIFGRPDFELGGIGGALAEQLLVQEVLGGILATELERPILEAGLCDYVRVVPGVSTFGGLLRPDFLTTLGAATIECGRELTENVFLTVETGIGPLFGDRASLLWGVGLEWQITPEWMWEMSYGPVRRDPLLGVGRGTQTIRYQLSTDIRRRWEYGLPTRRVPIQIPDPGSPPVELNVGPGGSGDAAGSGAAPAAAPAADGTGTAQVRRPPPRPEEAAAEGAGTER